MPPRRRAAPPPIPVPTAIPAFLEGNGAQYLFFEASPGEVRHPQASSLNPSGTLFATCTFFSSHPGRVDVFDVRDSNRHWYRWKPSRQGLFNVATAFLSDEVLLVASVFKSETVLSAHEANTGTLLWEHTFPKVVYAFPLGGQEGVAWIATLRKNEGLALHALDGATGTPRSEPWSLACSDHAFVQLAPNAPVVYLCADSTVSVCDLHEQRKTVLFLCGGKEARLYIAPSGKVLLVRERTGFTAHALPGGATIARYTCARWVESVAMSPDGQWFVTSEIDLGSFGDSRVEFAWIEAATGEERHRVCIPRLFSTAGLSFDAAGRCLVMLTRKDPPHGVLVLTPP